MSIRWVAAVLAMVGVAAAAPKQPTTLPSIDDLPKLSVARPSAGKIATSTRLNTEGYKLHAAKDLIGAANRYKAAVVADPGNLLARYNLASALVSAGDAPGGLKVLAQFRAVADCRACVGS